MVGLNHFFIPMFWIESSLFKVTLIFVITYAHVIEQLFSIHRVQLTQHDHVHKFILTY